MSQQLGGTTLGQLSDFRSRRLSMRSCSIFKFKYNDMLSFETIAEEAKHTMRHTRPFLKWAGNKYNCLHHILTSLPKGTRLIEPFAGSGAVFINTNYSQYFIAEENNDLIALFQHLQNEGDSFIDFCESYFSLANNNQEQYYLHRNAFNQSIDSRHRAALFLYLNHHGYNGLCRYNSSGGFNVPFGRYVKPRFPKSRMLFFYQKCHNVVFKQCDFRETFALARPGDVIYCDPPYSPIQQESNFSAYTAKKFGPEEQILLAELAKSTAKRGITVIISNHDTEFTRHHYEQSIFHSFPVARHISRDLKKRVPVQELLAIFQ